MPLSRSSRNEDLLDRFCDALWLEDGLARNTIESYRRDLTQFSAWLGSVAGRSLDEARHADLQAYLAHLFGARKAPLNAVQGPLVGFTSR